MSEKCGRCGKSVYANDNPQRVNEKVYHGMCFKCKLTTKPSKLLPTVKSPLVP